MIKRKRKRKTGGRIRQYRPRRYGGNIFRSAPFFGSWPGDSFDANLQMQHLLRQMGGNSSLNRGLQRLRYLRRRLRGQ